MLIDAHAHLDQYGEAAESVLEQITENRVFTVSASMDLFSYERNRALGEMCKLVLPTFGIHPWNAPEHVDRLEDLSRFIQESPMLGEIGLDYHFVEDASLYPAQRKVFEFFLQAAREQGKIVTLHTKRAEEEIPRLLNDYEIQRAIIHWYSGPLDIFHKLLARGTYFTIGVEVLYSKHIQTIARELPLEQLLTETDNPGGLRWLTGTLGMPLVVKDVVEARAKLRQATPETIIQAVENNFLRLIRGDLWLSDTYTMIEEQRNTA